MKNELLKHKLAYFLLLLGIGIFTFYFFSVWPNRLLQQRLIIGFGVFYFVWGIVTHLKQRRLTGAVWLEYAGAASLAAILMICLITL